MPIPLFNKFGNVNNNYASSHGGRNILSQFLQIKKNPGVILDILLRNSKINQLQYKDLMPYKNNPEMIVKYLINNGKGEEIAQTESLVNNIKL